MYSDRFADTCLKMSRDSNSPARGISGIRELSDREEETLDLENIGMEEISYDNVASSSRSQHQTFDNQHNVSLSNSTADNPKTERGVRTIPSGSGFTFLASAGEDTDVDDLGGGVEGEQNIYHERDLQTSTSALTDSELAKSIIAKTLKGGKLLKSQLRHNSRSKGAKKYKNNYSDLESSPNPESNETASDGLEEEQDEEKSKLERELTEKYLSNEITFKDYVRQIAPDNDSDNESDEDVKGPDSSEEIDDSDWVPSPTKKHKKDQPDKSKRKRNDFDDNDVDQSPESQFAKDLKHTTRQQLGKKRQRLGIAPRKKRLDPALQGLMGEANLRFARGDTDTAIRMCMEVIRQEPGVPEPFQTLSTLYEETGNEEKAFQFALIAAHLAPQDAEEWGRLADMSLEHGDRKQAVACFRKAVDADPQCLKYHWSRCDLLEQLGEKSKALMAFKRMLSVLKGISENPEENEEFDPAEIGIEYIRAAREAARLYHEKSNVEDARKVIQEAINLHPSSAENGDINLLLDLLMSEKMYEDAMQVICEHCDAKFEASKKQSDLSQLESNQQLQAFTAIRLPESTPVEIYSKLIIILLQLNASHLIPEIVQVLLDEDTEEFGDLMLDVAEAYMSKENYLESLKFLEKLVNSVNYSQAAVWLQYGESLCGVGKLEDAEMAYKKVVALAPQHHDARRSLSSILNELGRPDEALLTLDQDEEAELLNPSLLYEKCNLLYSEERMDEFASKAELLLSRHFTQIRNKEEMYAIAAQKRLNKKTKAIAEVRSFRQEPLLDQREADFEADTVITLSKEYELFHKLCEFYYQNKKYSELQRLTFSALGSPLFNKSEETMKECEFLCLVASFSNGDSYHAYNFVRDMVVKDANNNRLWNLFNLVIR